MSLLGERVDIIYVHRHWLLLVMFSKVPKERGKFKREPVTRWTGGWLQRKATLFYFHRLGALSSENWQLEVPMHASSANTGEAGCSQVGKNGVSGLSKESALRHSQPKIHQNPLLQMRIESSSHKAD